LHADIVTKTPEKITSREERFIFVHRFRVSIHGWLALLFWGLWQGITWQRTCGRAKLFTSQWPGSKEREKERARITIALQRYLQ
jgi:hypothetical protein